jgi:hypothetical protein
MIDKLVISKYKQTLKGGKKLKIIVLPTKENKVVPNGSCGYLGACKILNKNKPLPH